MKSVLNYLMAAGLILLAYGCGKEGNIVESGATYETSAMVISGQVSPWALGSDVEVKLADGSGKINSDGSFRISVPAPDKSELRPIALLSETELSISDPSAKFLIASPELYANGEFFGILEWNSEFTGGKINAKSCKAVYFYCDKDVTVSGASYGFTAQAGWNTLYVYGDGSSNFYYSDGADAEGQYTAFGLVRE